jgi:hypothetical protein
MASKLACLAALCGLGAAVPLVSNGGAAFNAPLFYGSAPSDYAKYPPGTVFTSRTFQPTFQGQKVDAKGYQLLYRTSVRRLTRSLGRRC